MLPTKDDLMRESDQQTRGQPELGPLGERDSEEEGEGTAVEQIRSDLQDAYQSIASAWEKLDDLEAEAS
jgi:hypothetical protein